MPIQVTCPSCFKRFTVNDKFAGKSGPCPNCRKPIKIPDKSEEVVIHAPEPTGPKDSKGKSVLSPIRRKDFSLSMPVILITGLSSLIVLGLALGIRLSGQEPATALLIIGAIVMAAPLVFVGYWFLHDDELEGYRGRELLARCGVAALIFAATWLLYWLIPSYVSDRQNLGQITSGEIAIMMPIMLILGTVTAVLALELEVLQGMLLYLFYFIVTLFLALLMGTKLASSFVTEAPPTILQPGSQTDKNSGDKPKNATEQKPVVPKSDVNPPPAEIEKPKINILQ